MAISRKLFSIIAAMSTEKPHSKFAHLYALVRLDVPVDSTEPTNSFSVVKVYSSKLLAEKEARRLRQLNVDKGCTYHVYTTRYVSASNDNN